MCLVTYRNRKKIVKFLLQKYTFTWSHPVSSFIMLRIVNRTNDFIVVKRIIHLYDMSKVENKNELHALWSLFHGQKQLACDTITEKCAQCPLFCENAKKIAKFVVTDTLKDQSRRFHFQHLHSYNIIYYPIKIL